MLKRLTILASLACAVVITTVAAALDVPRAPSLDRPIVDQTGTLSAQQIDQLSQQIATERGQKDYQIGVLMIPSLDGQPIEDYSIKVARAWGIGAKDKNNGILLLIARNDHLMRIEVGSGLEGDLTDIQTSHVINDVIAPRFKLNDFYGGISQGLESLTALVQGKADPHAAPEVSFWDIIGTIFGFSWFGFFGLAWLGSILGRSKSWWAGGLVGGVAGLALALMSGGTELWAWLVALALTVGGFGLDFLVSRNYKQHASRGEHASWWAGGGSFGGGSTGGGSFGGGGFSGGGSSGSW